MGEENYWEREVVITELTKGRELMCQLRKHFDPMKQDVCNYLSEEILSSYDKALSLLNGTALSAGRNKGNEVINPTPSSSTAKLIDSPHLLADSSTKSSARPCNSRKRKTLSRRTEYVHARSGEEFPPEDGYSWRKYGQKSVLGATHPREYYRCARRHLSFCMATKQVQRSETEPSVFEVTYVGSHSCGQELGIKNQDGEVNAVATKEITKSDELVAGSGAGKDQITESYIPEMVSTPNNSFTNSNSLLNNIANSDFMTTPTSSPHDPADWNFSAEDTFAW